MEKGALEKNGYRKVLENSLRRKQGEAGLVRRELWRGVKVRANIWVIEKRVPARELYYERIVGDSIS